MLIVTLVGAWIEVWIVGIIWGGFVEVNKGEWGTDSIGLDKGFVAWYLWAKKIVCEVRWVGEYNFNKDSLKLC